MLFLPKALAPQLLLSRIPGNHAASPPQGVASPQEAEDTRSSRTWGSRIIYFYHESNLAMLDGKASSKCSCKRPKRAWEYSPYNVLPLTGAAF